MQAAKVLVRLCGCTGLPDLLLLASAKISIKVDGKSPNMKVDDKQLCHRDFLYNFRFNSIILDLNTT